MDAERTITCEHLEFESQAIVNRLEDSGLFMLDLKVWCSACALPFEFPEEIPIGVDLHGVTRSVTGQELRTAIKPATGSDEWSDRALEPEAEPRIADPVVVTGLAWQNDLVPVEMTQAEVDALLEYSTTLPTGKTIGKQWKRRLYVGPKAGSWVLCEYVADPDPAYVGIRSRLIVVSPGPGSADGDVLCPCGHSITRHGEGGCDAYIRPGGACCTRTPAGVMIALGITPGTIEEGD